VRSQRAMSPLTDPWSQASEALRPRDLRGDDGAALCLDTVDEPLRRWGSQTGGLGERWGGAARVPEARDHQECKL
jgi:hypothetical protein